MGSTKIINILKDDTFDEILGLFKETPAEEVIFVLPKRSKAFSKEGHFVVLAKEAKSLNKKVSLLSSSPQASAMGRAYQFEVMSGESPKKVKKQPKANFAKMGDIENEFDDVRDGSDAFERDVVVPSDEMVITPDEKEEEDPGVHIEELEKEKEEEETDEVEPLEEELEELKEEEPILEEEEKVIETSVPTRPRYRVVPATAINRNIDGVTPAVRQQRIMRPQGLPAIKVAQKSAAQESLNELEQVWREELRAPNSSVWSESPSMAAAQPAPKIESQPVAPVAAPVPGTSYVARKSNHIKKFLIGLSGAALLTFGVIVFVSSGSAQVSIHPVEKALDFTIKIRTSDTYATIDTDLQKVPGQVLNINKNVQQSFKATGTKDVAQKTRGKLTIKNELSTTQTLIATTRFENPSGFVFRTLRAVNVPANGSMEVEVIADKPGKDYNLAPTTFILPAFRERADTERLQKITGTSTVAFTGGIVGTAKVVTELDYSTAEGTVREQLEKDINEALAQQTADLIIPKSYDPVLQPVQSSAKVDEAVDEFTISANANVKVIGFKKTDFESLLKSYSESQYTLRVFPERLNIEFKNPTITENPTILEVDVAVTGNGYAQLQQDKLLNDLLGQKESTIKDYLKATVGVASAKVILSPFWVRKMPKDPSKVKIELVY